MAKNSPEVLVKLSKNPKKRIKMLINDIITEEIRLKEVWPFKGVTFANNGDATYDGKKYVWDKNAGSWYLPGKKELIGKSNSLYNTLAKALLKQQAKVNKQAGKNPGRGRLAPDTYGDPLTPGKVLKKAAAAAGRYGIDMPSDAVAGGLKMVGRGLKKGYNALSKALGGTQKPVKQTPGTPGPGLKKGDKVSFVSNHRTSKGKQVMATVLGQSKERPELYQVKSDTNPNPFLIPADRLTKLSQAKAPTPGSAPQTPPRKKRTSTLVGRDGNPLQY
jgi:hypothetical protein